MAAGDREDKDASGTRASSRDAPELCGRPFDATVARRGGPLRASEPVHVTSIAGDEVVLGHVEGFTG